MQAPDVIDRLGEMGLTLSAEGPNIRVAPKVAITDEVRRLIQAHKPRLLAALHQSGHYNAHEAAREAAEERAAIVEHEGGFFRVDAEIIAALTEGFYQHIFGPARRTGCCYAPAGWYCPEGERLRATYYSAVRRLDDRKRAGESSGGCAQAED